MNGLSIGEFALGGYRSLLFQLFIWVVMGQGVLTVWNALQGRCLGRYGFSMVSWDGIGVWELASATSHTMKDNWAHGFALLLPRRPGLTWMKFIWW